MEAYTKDPHILTALHADIQAVYDRDPACSTYTQCLIWFKGERISNEGVALLKKRAGRQVGTSPPPASSPLPPHDPFHPALPPGFQALQSHRISHWLWVSGRRALAVALQSRMSEVFHVDIHPAAVLGCGIMLDHATGVVIGETARVGDNVSMLHHVTLGGTGASVGVRHPSISEGVLLGASVTVLGNVTVGDGAKVGAGSVVLTDVPAHRTAVGVPAKVMRAPGKVGPDPSLEMDQTSFLEWSDYEI